MGCTHGRSAGGDAFQLEQDDDARPCDVVGRMEQTREQPAGRCRGGCRKRQGQAVAFVILTHGAGCLGEW